MAWVPCCSGKPLPRGAFAAGYSNDAGVLYVGRTIQGDAKAGYVQTSNGCPDGIAQKLQAGRSTYDDYQVLVVRQSLVQWIPFKVADALPQQSFLTCRSKTYGPVYLGKDSSGGLGAIYVSDGRDLKVSSFGRASEGEVLVLTPEIPVACGARFELEGSVLAHSKSIRTFWTGHESHLHYKHNSSFQESTDRETEHTCTQAADMSAAQSAAMSFDEGGSANAGAGFSADAGFSAEASAHAEGHMSVLSGVGGPKMDAFANANGFAKAAAHAAAEACLSVAAQATQSVGAQFAEDFHAVTSSTQASGSVQTEHKETIKEHIGVWTGSRYETRTIDNLDSEQTKHIYQLVLWVQYTDGFVRSMPTLLIESSFSTSPPPLKPSTIHQFGLLKSTTGTLVDPKTAWERHAIEGPDPAEVMCWSPCHKDLPIPRGALMAGMHERLGSMYVGRSDSALIGTLGTTTGDGFGVSSQLHIHRRGYHGEWEGPLGRFWEQNLDSFYILLADAKYVDWQPVRQGEVVPDKAYRAGFEPTRGPLFVGRDAHGTPGKLGVREGKAHFLWCAEHNQKVDVVEVLCMKQRKPVRSGAEFRLQKAILGRQIEKVTVTSGNKSEASRRFNFEHTEEQSQSSTRQESAQGATTAVNQASTAASAQTGAHASASAGSSASAAGSLQEKIEASVGGGLWSFFGGPSASMSQELKASAFAALKMGAEAAAGVTLGAGGSLALHFAVNFVAGVCSNALQSHDTSHQHSTVRDHVIRHTNGTEETMIISNAHDDRNLYIYQLHLFVDFDDGSRDEMGTLLSITSRSDAVPVPDAAMLKQFGL